LKSTSRLVGAHPLSALAATLESRLLAAGPIPSAIEIDAIRAEYAALAEAADTFRGLLAEGAKVTFDLENDRQGRASAVNLSMA
jgi:hypothetical protein